MTQGDLFLGTIGWKYRDWVGNLFPERTRARDYLREYSGRLSSVEVDQTFQGVPKASTVDGWRRKTPPGFVFAARFPRVIAESRFEGCNREVVSFLETMDHLEEKLGPLLLQLPPRFDVSHIDTLARFLITLPKSYKYAIEVRHASWLGNKDFFKLLRRHRVAFAMIEHPHITMEERITSSFVYIRMVGEKGTVSSFREEVLDRSEELQMWAERIKGYKQKGLDVYGYVSNQWTGHSPTTCLRLRTLMEGGSDPGLGTIEY